MFADDLFLLSANNKQSTMVLNLVLTDFGSISRLKQNLSKSEVFLAGLNESLKQEFCSNLENAGRNITCQIFGNTPNQYRTKDSVSLFLTRQGGKYRVGAQKFYLMDEDCNLLDLFL